MIAPCRLLLLGVTLTDAFYYHPNNRPLPEVEWDIWRAKREVFIDCDRVKFVPQSENDNEYAEEVCIDTCKNICQDPKTLQDLASCLGRMELLSCQFGYTQVKSFDVLGHWCVDQYKHMHMLISNSSIWTFLKNEALQTKIYLDIDPSRDATCRDGAGAILDILKVTSGDEDFLDAQSVQCTANIGDASKRDTVNGHELHLERSVMGNSRIMFVLHPALLNLFEAWNGTMHWDIAMAACHNGALSPPPFTQTFWGGVVLEVQAPITSVQELYKREEDSDFWSWKGPFTKW